jgi:hypothetical protein
VRPVFGLPAKIYWCLEHLEEYLQHVYGHQEGEALNFAVQQFNPGIATMQSELAAESWTWEETFEDITMFGGKCS